jgi:hypothetical protein
MHREGRCRLPRPPELERWAAVPTSLEALGPLEPGPSGLMGAIIVPDRVLADRSRLTGGRVTAGLDFGLIRLRSRIRRQDFHLSADYVRQKSASHRPGSRSQRGATPPAMNCGSIIAGAAAVWNLPARSATFVSIGPRWQTTEKERPPK